MGRTAKIRHRRRRRGERSAFRALRRAQQRDQRELPYVKRNLSTLYGKLGESASPPPGESVAKIAVPPAPPVMAVSPMVPGEPATSVAVTAAPVEASPASPEPEKKPRVKKAPSKADVEAETTPKPKRTSVLKKIFGGTKAKE